MAKSNSASYDRFGERFGEKLGDGLGETRGSILSILKKDPSLSITKLAGPLGSS